jgi:hypothetical protein
LRRTCYSNCIKNVFGNTPMKYCVCKYVVYINP